MGVFQSDVFQNSIFQGPHASATPEAWTPDPGSRFVKHTSRTPHNFTKKRYEKLLREVENEKRQKAKEAAAKREAARREAALTPLQLAQRALANVEAELARLTTRYFANPTKEVYDKLNDLTEQRNELALRVAELTEQETRAQEAQELSERQALKAQADAILAEIQRQQLSGRVADINLGAANSLGPQQINQAMQMARLMRIATEQQRAQQDAIRLAAERARQEQARIAAQKAKQEEDEMNELIQLGMQWTNLN